MLNGICSQGLSWSTVPAIYDQRMFPVRGMSTCFLSDTIYSKVRYIDLCVLADALLLSPSAFVVCEGCRLVSERKHIEQTVLLQAIVLFFSYSCGVMAYGDSFGMTDLLCK